MLLLVWVVVVVIKEESAVEEKLSVSNWKRGAANKEGISPIKEGISAVAETSAHL